MGMKIISCLFWSGVLSSVVLCVGCGGTERAGGPPTQDSGTAGDAGTTQCVSEVSAVIDGGCTRCWPAARVMCTKGNPAAVLGMLHCLTNNTCWDEGDPNSAGPCMQNVINTYGDSNVTAVNDTLKALGCTPDGILAGVAFATEMSPSDRKTFATCLAQIAPDAGACVGNALPACLAKTAYNASLCQN